MDVILEGLTWDHPRGYAPLLAGAPAYEAETPGVRVRWQRRTLREFGEAPIEQYLDRYDLIIVDHPFVGFAAAHRALLDFASHLSAEEKERFARDSVGPSWESYWYAGGLWALPIDAATQVACYRPDLLPRLAPAPSTFAEVLELARQARSRQQYVVVPACPTDAISLFFTLTAGLGHPISETDQQFVEAAMGLEVLDRLHSLIALAHPKSVDWNPIQVYDFMISTSDAVYCPWGFGYSNYSRRQLAVRLTFTDAPGLGKSGCAGTMLGGTGVAVSANSAHQREAVAYAKWATGAEHQRGLYFRAGGQPASLAAWTDPGNDAAANGFFSGTLATLQSAYLRPRFDGFVRYFEAAGIQINRCLRGEVTDAALLGFLNTEYASRQAAAALRI